MNLGAGLAENVCHQRGRSGRGCGADGECEVDIGLPLQCGIDLAEFDAEPAHLDLEVAATLVLEFVVRGPSHEIAGAVHPLTRCVRIGDETAGGQPIALVIAARDARAGQIQLTDRAARHRPQPRIEHDSGDAQHNAADGYRPAGAQWSAQGHGDRRFGGPVAVQQRPPGPGRHQLRRTRVTTDDDRVQIGQRYRVQGTHHGRGDVEMGDLVGAQDFGHLLARIGRRRHDSERRTCREGDQDLLDRNIEARRNRMCHYRIGGDIESGAGTGDQIRQAAMRHQHTLGQSCRSGGVDDVGDLIQMYRRAAFGIGDRRRILRVHRFAGRIIVEQ